MGSKGLVGLWFLVGDDMGAWGANGHAVKIKMAMYLYPGGQLWVDVGAAQQVE